MNENQTPWAAAAEATKSRGQMLHGEWLPNLAERMAIIKEACERHASDLRAELDAMRARHPEDACADMYPKLRAENAALAAKVEQLRAALAKISPVKLVWLAQWCDKMDDDRFYTGKREVQTDLREWATIIQEALSDAPPPAVVPAADVEPLLEAFDFIQNGRTIPGYTGNHPDEVIRLCKQVIHGAQTKAKEALAAYRSRHPASVPPSALGAGES